MHIRKSIKKTSLLHILISEKDSSQKTLRLDWIIFGNENQELETENSEVIAFTETADAFTKINKLNYKPLSAQALFNCVFNLFEATLIIFIDISISISIGIISTTSYISYILLFVVSLW